jgi:hypothetical protein
MKIHIAEPLWTYKGKDGGPSVGVAPYKLRGLSDDLEIEVLYRDKDKKLYDGVFSMSAEKARSFPKFEFRCGEMIVIPLDEFSFTKHQQEGETKDVKF